MTTYIHMLTCICMLTKRTQILFDKELWNTIVALAKQEKISVGELVRKTLREKYEEEKILEKRKEAVQAIFSFREKYGKKLAQGENSTSILRRMRDERYGDKK